MFSYILDFVASIHTVILCRLHRILWGLLVDNAFAPNFRDAFLHSVLLAKAVGVKEEEILVSTEDIDSFFLD